MHKKLPIWAGPALPSFSQHYVEEHVLSAPSEQSIFRLPKLLGPGV